VAKMKATDADVLAFIESIESEKKRDDAYRLLSIFEEETAYPAVMWGDSIIGFGRYHYVYESGHSGDAPKAAFSPRKARHSLYLLPYDERRDDYLRRLGKVKAAVSCIYVNKLDDIDTDVLRELIRETVKRVDELYPNN